MISVSCIRGRSAYSMEYEPLEIKYDKWPEVMPGSYPIKPDAPQPLQAKTLTVAKADARQTQGPHPNTHRRAIGRLQSHLGLSSSVCKPNGVPQRRAGISNSDTEHLFDGVLRGSEPDNKGSSV